VHAQFELIHPFLDGNGRMGRLLIPLYLYQRKVLSYPMFYMSDFLESHRDGYYSRLRSISRAGKWNEWIEFFLAGVTNQALQNRVTLARIALLRAQTQETVVRVTNSPHSGKMVQAIFTQPVFQAKDFVALTGLTKETAARNLRQLKAAGILTVVRKASGQTPGRLAFTALVDIVSGRESDATS
jgi:Fic family protein